MEENGKELLFGALKNVCVSKTMKLIKKKRVSDNISIEHLQNILSSNAQFNLSIKLFLRY